MNTLRRIRPWVQTSALGLFLALLIGAGKLAFPPADLFFRLDPLAALASLVAARRLVPALAIGAAITLLATLILGRVWCGWLCPLGAVLDITPSIGRRTPARQGKRYQPDPAPWLRQVKYLLLTLIAVAALLGNLTFLVLDPITLIYRTLTAAAWPTLVALISGAEAVLYRVPFLRAPIDAFEGAFRGTLLPLTQPAYGLGIPLALLFVGILALNAVRARFWCRYLCPLGALLGWVSRIAWLRRSVGDVCVDCQRCARACPTGTIDPQQGFASDPAECTLCLECVPACPQAGQHFGGRRRPAARPAYDPTRRQFLAAAGTAAVAAGLFAAEPAAVRADPRLIRPPGAQDAGFLARCIRCGVCVKACPTAGLQPSFDQAGWAGLWTPVLVPRLGHCDYACNACGDACPTDAIPALPLAAKRQTVIGHAAIDRNRCLPWADNLTCLVCEEMCPLPAKAIRLEDVTVWPPEGGEPRVVRRPVVLQERCIGCGICENRCPLNGEAAIRVSAPTTLNTGG